MSQAWACKPLPPLPEMERPPLAAAVRRSCPFLPYRVLLVLDGIVAQKELIWQFITSLRVIRAGSAGGVLTTLSDSVKTKAHQWKSGFYLPFSFVQTSYKGRINIPFHPKNLEPDFLLCLPRTPAPNPNPMNTALSLPQSVLFLL